MRRKSHPTCPIVVTILVTILSTAASPKTIYVDTDATGANNGYSWADGFLCLQNALTVARDGDEIWVAEGTYTPDRRTVWDQPGAAVTASGNRMSTFRLIDGVALRGGYAGVDAANPNERVITLYESVLSGDLDGNDGPDGKGTEENSYCVVTSILTGPRAILDGFTITGASYHGMENRSSSPTVTQCTFRQNRTDRRWGGGMHNSMASPRISLCTFVDNVAKYGGAIWNSNATPRLTQCVFSANAATRGGAICNYLSSPILTACEFSFNSGEHGSGMYNESNSHPILTDCLFSCNKACPVTPNSCGGAIYNTGSAPRLNDCMFSGNEAEWGGGLFNDNSHPILAGCTFGGNLGAWGGGIYNRDDSHPVLLNCTFTGNRASRWGGGLSNAKSSPWLINCTFSANDAPLGIGVHSFDSDSILINCILWGNISSTVAQIHNEGASSTTVNYSVVQNGYPGINNINANPMFVDHDGADDCVGTMDDDLRLQSSSPCINAGENIAVPIAFGTDRRGLPRIAQGLVDMGAFEWHPRRIDSGETPSRAVSETGMIADVDSHKAGGQ
ncbi:MAG: right-handed parallel beta-helix repeat-containing protein [Planctomycetota bacterium]|jgi:hypothetical protein